VEEVNAGRRRDVGEMESEARIAAPERERRHAAQQELPPVHGIFTNPFCTA